MVFVNLDKKPKKQGQASASQYGKVFKCMNCGSVIEQPVGIYGRRFCSTKCQEEYLG
ncbi:MAG: hypothetical protein HY544_01990 [Candidatus Diapherotrites archaeon]|uniref:Uncharacterized protein n=1 Tax=Candidatus Iainarchaeum sp. TaxID=3101447 RepID=A0A8T3YLS0_9ARCH|nr:hypothetical protein [Candidatus Diapherotrites archaeon]